TNDIVILLVLIAVIVVAFIREWGTPDTIALIAFGAVIVFGLIDRSSALDALANPAPITIACMFVISAALERTGAITLISTWFQRAAGTRETRVLAVLMLVALVLSAFVNNTPVVVVFLPVVVSLARTSGLKASRLLIPLSYAAVIGGTCTLIGTSTNLVIDGAARSIDPSFKPFTMFEFTTLGLAFAAVGFLYMLFVGRHLLPDRETFEQEVDLKKNQNVLTQIEVLDGSPLVGKPLTQTFLTDFPDSKILEVRRRGHVLTAPLDTLEIRSGDRLLVTVQGTTFADFKKTGSGPFACGEQHHLKVLETRELKLLEGLVNPGSSFVGKTLKEISFRQSHGVIILAVHRRGIELDNNFGSLRLHVGDTLLVEGSIQAVNRLAKNLDVINLNAPTERPFKPLKAAITASVVVAFATLAAFNALPISTLAILAAITVIATGCIRTQEAYRAVHWDIIFLIIGMLGVGQAMQQTGTADLVANNLSALVGDASPLLALAALYLLAWVLTEFISNQAVAVILTPIALGLATQLPGVTDPRPFVIAVMFACSASFSTPFGYQTNTYIYGAGGYRFTDFTKVGLPLNIILWLTATALIPILFPFDP
ncbi:MAG: SLC13 family permease, partial [Verrucomicrobiales bacterium]|nr:SLC13 family permease [Verrucomicrobiales bacterium]